MRLILIRHGRPEWRRPFLISLSQFERVSPGYDAARLSKAGAEAVQPLAQQWPQAFMLSSDLPRARDTADTIAGQGRAIECTPLFRELQAPRITADLWGRLWAPAVL